MADILELIPTIRVAVKLPGPGNVSKSERRFLDFIINGQSLWGRVGKPKDSVSVFCYEYSRAETIKAAYRLLLTERAVIPGDRRSLFICSECGDIGCGAVTVSVAREGRSAVWKDFGYENDYEENIQLDEYKEIGPYTFDWGQYERVLLQAIESLNAHKI